MDLVGFVSSECCHDYPPLADLQSDDLLGVRAGQETVECEGGARDVVGRSDEGTARLLDKVFETLLDSAAGSS